MFDYCLWLIFLFFVFFFKQKTAYEMRISDWSSDVCSSDLRNRPTQGVDRFAGTHQVQHRMNGLIATDPEYRGAGNEPRVRARDQLHEAGRLSLLDSARAKRHGPPGHEDHVPLGHSRSFGHDAIGRTERRERGCSAGKN